MSGLVLLLVGLASLGGRAKRVAYDARYYLLHRAARLAADRAPARREQRRLYQMARRRADGVPTRAEANAHMRQVIAVEVVVPLEEQHPLYAKAIEALMMQRAAFGPGASLVFPEEWLMEDAIQDAVVGLLEDRPTWLDDAKRAMAHQRAVLRYQLVCDDGLRHTIPIMTAED